MTPEKMPLRSVKVPDEIWVPAQEKAKAEGKSLSQVIREALSKYAEKQ